MCVCVLEYVEVFNEKKSAAKNTFNPSGDIVRRIALRLIIHYQLSL